MAAAAHAAVTPSAHSTKLECVSSKYASRAVCAEDSVDQQVGDGEESVVWVQCAEQGMAVDDDTIEKVESTVVTNADARKESDENEVWVQCELCSKWRRLIGVDSTEPLAEHWHCSLNPDPLRASCESPEENWKQIEFDEEVDAQSLELITSSTARSGYKGVYPSGSHFIAQFKKEVIGKFNTVDDAARCYALHVAKLQRNGELSAGDAAIRSDGPRRFTSASYSEFAPDELEMVVHEASEPFERRSPTQTIPAAASASADGDGTGDGIGNGTGDGTGEAAGEAADEAGTALSAAQAAQIVEPEGDLQLIRSARSRSGYKGVQQVNRRKTGVAFEAWMGRIFLGTYPTAEEAAFVYMQHVASSGKGKRTGLLPVRAGAMGSSDEPGSARAGDKGDAFSATALPSQGLQSPVQFSADMGLTTGRASPSPESALFTAQSALITAPAFSPPPPAQLLPVMSRDEVGITTLSGGTSTAPTLPTMLRVIELELGLPSHLPLREKVDEALAQLGLAPTGVLIADIERVSDFIQQLQSGTVM
uniref:CW-type domain-containing protein n=1 Tax=Calcidiscus leptoporus TaxID=127549 RepID=A0A7S0NUF1_9EUKA